MSFCVIKRVEAYCRSPAVMISASREEMLLAGEAPQDSVQLSGNRGYLASLGVFHELHCLVNAPLA